MGSDVALATTVLGAYRASLEASIELLHNRLIFWTAIVVFGLNLEVWAEFVGPAFEKYSHRCKWFGSWVHVYSRVGILLVISGVAGELFIETQAPIPEEKLRALNNDALASLNHQSALANERASANEREAGQLRKRAEKLEIDAANLRKANLELEAELSPRLFEDQYNAAQRLKGFPKTPPIRLEYLLDVECKRAAEQIAFVLEEAKLKYSPVPVLNPGLKFQDAVTIGGSGANSELGYALIDLLNKTGIDADLMPPGIASEDAMLIRVGMKPSPEEHKGMQKRATVDAIERSVRPFDTDQKFQALQDAKREWMQALKARTGVGGNRAPLPSR